MTYARRIIECFCQYLRVFSLCLASSLPAPDFFSCLLSVFSFHMLLFHFSVLLIKSVCFIALYVALFSILFSFCNFLFCFSFLCCFFIVIFFLIFVSSFLLLLYLLVSLPAFLLSLACYSPFLLIRFIAVTFFIHAFTHSLVSIAFIPSTCDFVF